MGSPRSPATATGGREAAQAGVRNRPTRFGSSEEKNRIDYPRVPGQVGDQCGKLG
jgi:hypothetical protein